MANKMIYRYTTKLLTASVLLLLLLVVPATAYASTISRSYTIEGGPTKGNLVSLDITKPGTGHLATIANSSDLLGIVVGRGDSLLAIDPSDSTAQVAIEGTAPVLVSTINGDISKGDLISVSPLSGLGMKAQPGLPVIGSAQAAFTSQSSAATTQQITDKGGKSRSVKVGFTSVAIKINTSTEGSTSINSLQKAVKSLTGRVIPTVRIIISLVIVTITLVTLVMLIYASIFGSIISIGRNPLAKSAILRTLRSVLALSALLAAMTAVALLLLLS